MEANDFGVAAADMNVSVTHRFEPAQGAVEVVSATTQRLTRAFVDLPYALYAHDPHWVPPLRRDEHRRLDPRHNPFFDHGEMVRWVARERGQVVGRIAAMEDRLHNHTHAERLGWFGFFEAVHAPAASALLEAAEQWARDRGCTAVRGPANPSLNESAGLLADAFDEDPYVLMPYNPPSYVGFIEDAGYRKVKDLLAWTIDLTRPVGERITKLADRVARRHGIVIRPVDMKAFARDLAHLKTVYRAAWERNWGFVPPTDREIDQLAVDLRPIIEPSLALFAEKDGRPVAVVVAIPDVNQVLKRMNGRLFPGLVHFLGRRSIINQSRVILLGVLPEARRMGLYPLLVAALHKNGVALGYRRAELSWTLEDNDAINAGIEASGGRRYKTYRLYEKSLA